MSAAASFFPNRQCAGRLHRALMMLQIPGCPRRASFRGFRAWRAHLCWSQAPRVHDGPAGHCVDDKMLFGSVGGGLQ